MQFKAITYLCSGSIGLYDEIILATDLARYILDLSETKAHVSL